MNSSFNDIPVRNRIDLKLSTSCYSKFEIILRTLDVNFVDDFLPPVNTLSIVPWLDFSWSLSLCYACKYIVNTPWTSSNLTMNEGAYMLLLIEV